MPIIQIYSEIPSKAESVSNLIENIRDLGSKALSCEPSNLWVLVHPISSGYAMGAAGDGFRPLVFIKANRGRSLEQKEKFIRAVEQALSFYFLVSTKDIWIHYQEMNPEDIWHQGRWTALS